MATKATPKKKRSRAARHHAVPHEHLSVRETELTVRHWCDYTDDNGVKRRVPIEIQWATSKDRPGAYEGKILVNDGHPVANKRNWTLSLYTLGLQGRLWKVDVMLRFGSSVEIVSPDGTGEALDVVTIPKTGVKGNANPKKHPPNEDNIGFIRFSDSVVKLVAWSSRQRHVEHDDSAPSVKESHETVPPPPDPGGEEGDGED